MLPPYIRQLLHQHHSGIVPRQLIFSSRIPEPHNYFHTSGPNIYLSCFPHFTLFFPFSPPIISPLTGITILPPDFNWSIRACGTSWAFAATIIPSYGACSDHPFSPTPTRNS